VKDPGSQSLLPFIRFLRSRDLPVSPADTLDALEVAHLLGFSDRSLLRQGLAATLAKSAPEEQVFCECFDTFFNYRSDLPSTTEEDSPPQSANTTTDPLVELAKRQPEIAGLMGQPLLQALRMNDQNTLSLAIEEAALEVDLQQIKLFTQRGQYVRKILDALGESALRQAALELAKDEPEAAAALNQYREELRLQVRERVERAYVIHASGDTENFMDEALSHMRLGSIDPHHYQRLRRLMAKMVSKLAKRHGRRRRRTKRGQLNLSATLRRAVATDGIPFNPQWRQVNRRRPQILAICDVSGSVATYAKFLLMFIYAMQDLLPRTRSFAFSAQIGEVSDLLETLPIEKAVDQINRRYGGATDYAQALTEFCGSNLHEINSATTVVILGDARNNNGTFRWDLLAEIKARAQQLIWLNPEAQRAWGTGDSEMLRVIKHCHVATECNNLRQLERIVDKLLADSRRS
jgi:uncharacterized protein with von Willebrand factor type A (vWA) domain